MNATMLKVAALTVASMVAMVGLAAPRADAQTTSVNVTLRAISPQVPDASPMNIELDISGAEPTDDVRVTFYNRAGEGNIRRQVRRMADGSVTPTESFFNKYEVKVSELTATTNGARLLSIPNTSLPQTEGVYPIHLTVGTSRALLTWLVRVRNTDAMPMRYSLSLVLPITSQVTNRPDGSRLMTNGEPARIDAIADAINRAPENSLTLVPLPQTLDALSDAGPEAIATLDHLQRESHGQQVLASPYVPIDVDAWRRAGHEDHVVLQNRTGREVTAKALGISINEVSPRIALLEPSDTANSLDTRERDGATKFVVSEDNLLDLSANRFPSPFAQTFRLRDASGHDLISAVDDRWLRDRLIEVDDVANVAALSQDVVADLAAGYFDAPDISRGSVVVFPDDWNPTTAFTETLLPAIQGLDTLQLVNLDTFFETVSRSSPTGEGGIESLLSGPLRRSLIAQRGPDVEVHAAGLDEARNALASYQSLFRETGAQDPSRFEILLLASSDSRLDAAIQRSFINGVLDFVSNSVRDDAGDPAIVVPESERLTLTSRNETIRLGIENRLDEPLTVRIDLRSEKLAFPQGAIMTAVLEPGPNTISFDVTSKASGDSALEYTVSAPEGSVGELAKGTLRIRSIALSGLGVVLLVLAALVLAVWWIRHGMASRRARRIPASTG